MGSRRPTLVHLEEDLVLGALVQEALGRPVQEVQEALEVQEGQEDQEDLEDLAALELRGRFRRTTAG